MTDLPHVEIATDGACKGNPGPGGWGAWLRSGDHEKELFGGDKLTTNNRMELTAVIQALASGQAKQGDDTLTLTATRGETQYGICSTAFLEYGFRTDSYRIDVTFHDADSWSYDIRTMLLVHGRPDPFDHHDQNRLRRVGPAKPNPLKAILDKRAAAAPA
jgi:hypothetical protein